MIHYTILADGEVVPTRATAGAGDDPAPAPDQRRSQILWGMELLPVPVLGELVELLCKVLERVGHVRFGNLFI
jgi:hypothetical protein